VLVRVVPTIDQYLQWRSRSSVAVPLWMCECECVTNPVLCPPSPMSDAVTRACNHWRPAATRRNHDCELSATSPGHTPCQHTLYNNGTGSTETFIGTAGPSGHDSMVESSNESLDELCTSNARRNLRGNTKRRPPHAHRTFP
jgi:hypothetical protein